MQWLRRFRVWIAGLALVLVVLILWPDTVLGSADAPSCDDAVVTKTVVEIFNLHPDYVGRSTKVMTGLGGAREVDFRRHPDVNATANTRWCEAEGRFSGGETETVYYDLFATRTLLMPMFGVRPCFGRFDPRFNDCSFVKPPRR